jgi:hypothetical protein
MSFKLYAFLFIQYNDRRAALPASHTCLTHRAPPCPTSHHTTPHHTTPHHTTPHHTTPHHTTPHHTTPTPTPTHLNPNLTPPQLGVPFFHHELVKQGLHAALDNPANTGAVIELLKR